MRSTAVDLGLRTVGSIALALYGVAVAFVALFVAAWDNKGANVWYEGKGSLTWLVVLWLSFSSILAFVASWRCLMDIADRPRFRTHVVASASVNGVLVAVGMFGSWGMLPYFAGPLLLGFCGLWLWAQVHFHDEAPCP